MPSLQRIVPHPVHMSWNGKNDAGVENGESVARNTDTLPELVRDEESNDGNVPLPQVVDECTPLQCTGVDDDYDEDNSNPLNSSVISDKTNDPKSSTDEGPEGGNAPPSKTARTALSISEKQVHVKYSPQTSTPTQQPNSGMPRHQSHTNAPTFIPSLERFYAFCINEASSIKNLEHIRRHLPLTLLDNVNGSLMEMRAKDSLVKSTTSGGITIDELSTEGLMNRLSRDVEKSTTLPNSKRSQCEEARNAETINDDSKRHNADHAPSLLRSTLKSHHFREHLWTLAKIARRYLGSSHSLTLTQDNPLGSIASSGRGGVRRRQWPRWTWSHCQ